MLDEMVIFSAGILGDGANGHGPLDHLPTRKWGLQCLELDHFL